MKEVILGCPNCGKKIVFKNYFDWVLHSPFHWFKHFRDYRYTKCPHCEQKSYMKRDG